MIWKIRETILRTTLALTGGMFLLITTGNAATVYGGNTSVALNSATVTALTGLGFSIAPVAPGTLTGLTASFPITGGNTNTVIDHSGGLAFTKGGVTADITNFVINLGTSTLTGDLIAGGTTTHNFTFFDLGAGGALTLDAALASGLSTVYGIPNLTGASIGTATVAAVLTPEPATFAIGAVGLLALGLRRRFSVK